MAQLHYSLSDALAKNYNLGPSRGIYLYLNTWL